MQDNIFYILKQIAKTGKLTDETEEIKKAEFKKLSRHYGTGRDQSYKNGDGTKVNQYRHGIMTDIGDVEVTEWIELANALIDKYNERDIFNELYNNYVFKVGRNSFNQFDVVNALALHMRRIFENPEWVDYNKFRTSLLDKRENRC